MDLAVGYIVYVLRKLPCFIQLLSQPRHLSKCLEFCIGNPSCWSVIHKFRIVLDKFFCCHGIQILKTSATHEKGFPKACHATFLWKDFSVCYELKIFFSLVFNLIRERVQSQVQFSSTLLAVECLLMCILLVNMVENGISNYNISSDRPFIHGMVS